MLENDRCIFVVQNNGLLSLPPITSPLISPFPIQLINQGTFNLAIIELSNFHKSKKHSSCGIILEAVINWSATFSPPSSISSSSILNNTGYANVTFEFLKNEVVIYRVTQTAAQTGISLNQPTVLFTSPVSTYEIASMLFFDANSFHGCCSEIYQLRATNILLSAPKLSTGGATITAAVGAVTFLAKPCYVRKD